MGIEFDFNPENGKYEEVDQTTKSFYDALECDDCGGTMDSGGISFWDGSNRNLRCSSCQRLLDEGRKDAESDLDEIDRILSGK